MKFDNVWYAIPRPIIGLQYSHNGKVYTCERINEEIYHKGTLEMRIVYKPDTESKEEHEDDF